MVQRKTGFLLLLVILPLASLLGIYAYFWGLGGDPLSGAQPVGSIGPCYNLTVIVSYGRDYGYGINQTFSSLDFASGTTVFDALRSVTIVNCTYYGSLVLVTGINGVFNNVTANSFWQYYVNGVFGPVASNLYHLANSSVVVWRYQPSRFS